jgi:hypothetical protein
MSSAPRRSTTIRVGRFVSWASLVVPPLVVPCLATPNVAAAEPHTPEALPPPPVEDFRPRRAPSPEWDLGLLAGVCGAGRDQLWQATYFCGDVVADVLWGREREKNAAWGLSLDVGTKGFEDGRYGAALVGLLPLADPLVGQLELGGLAVSDGSGVSPGLSARLGLGLRALNQRGHYGHSHQLVLGMTHVPGDDSRAGTTLSIALRVDAFWFAMPFGRL